MSTEPLLDAEPREPAGGTVAKRFMQLSGLLLIVLVLVHLLMTSLLTNGVHQVNFAFVAGRWSSPLWRSWDLVMLWLAELHGANGLRTVINDYARRRATRVVLTTLLAVSAVLVLVIGTYVIVTFNPDIG